MQGMSLAESNNRYQIKILVCAVERGDEVFIPDGNMSWKKEIGCMSQPRIRKSGVVFQRAWAEEAKVKKVLICGGGQCKLIIWRCSCCRLAMQVKIIEQNIKRCEELCELLPKATIISGDAANHELLVEEGINEADELIALTGMDEENIIMALFAKSRKVGKLWQK